MAYFLFHVSSDKQPDLIAACDDYLAGRNALRAHCQNHPARRDTPYRLVAAHQQSEAEALLRTALCAAALHEQSPRSAQPPQPMQETSVEGNPTPPPEPAQSTEPEGWLTQLDSEPAKNEDAEQELDLAPYTVYSEARDPWTTRKR